MKENRKIKKLSKNLFSLEKERDKYQKELLTDASNEEATQKFSNISDKIDVIHEDIKRIKEEAQE